MISLHNWLNSLVESFTFYGGGVGGGQSQTTTSGIDPSMRPYVEKVYQKLRNSTKHIHLNTLKVLLM